MRRVMDSNVPMNANVLNICIRKVARGNSKIRKFGKMRKLQDVETLR